MPNSDCKHRCYMQWIKLSLVVVALSIAACMTARGPATSQAKPITAVAAYRTTSPSADRGEVHDPVALLEEALARCDRRVQDYECIFERQERLNGKLEAPQRMRVRYHDQPLTIHMVWLENVDQVQQAWYAEGENISDDGKPQVVIEPAGKVLKALAPRISIDAQGELAKKSSRFTIDQFGFRSTLERILAGVRRFENDGVMQIEYAGTGAIDQRPTHVIVRRLPYDGPDSPYPEAKLIVHLDQETLMPLAVYCFADAGEQVLLGSYITTQVRSNTGWRHGCDGI